jgi:hypothetical protein
MPSGLLLRNSVDRGAVEFDVGGQRAGRPAPDEIAVEDRVSLESARRSAPLLPSAYCSVVMTLKKSRPSLLLIAPRSSARESYLSTRDSFSPTASFN